MATALPLGSAAQPQSPLGIHLKNKMRLRRVDENNEKPYRTAVSAAVSDGNKPEYHVRTCSGVEDENDAPSNISRIQYASLVSGVSRGQRSARRAKSSSDTSVAAWSFILQMLR